jgi:hypothetical protein
MTTKTAVNNTTTGRKPEIKKVNLMTDARVEKSRSYIQKQYKKCPVCGETVFIIHSPIGLSLIVPEEPEGYVIDEKTNIPAVPISCENCGFIALISADKVIGLK